MSPWLRSDARSERGQAVIVTALAMVILIAAVGFAVDIGHVLSIRRQLQASTDAAAAAGAQDIGLPGSTAATIGAKATLYSAVAGNKNARTGLPGVSITTSVVCKNFMSNLLGGSNCTSSTTPANTLVVTQSVTVPMAFAKVLGFDDMTVKTTATAGMSAGQVTPLDIVVVLDATWSMRSNCSGTALSKIDCAKQGIQTLLSSLWPCAPGATCTSSSTVIDQVGLVVFPPAVNTVARDKHLDCASTMTNADMNYENDADKAVDPNYLYAVVALSNDYKTTSNSALNASSNMVKAVTTTGGCGVETQPDLTDRVSTSFATAIEKAQAMLDAVNAVASKKRDKAQDVIIVLGDGGANYGPTYYGDASMYRTRPCQQAINSAAASTAKGTWVYSIAYDSSGDCLGWSSAEGALTTNRFTKNGESPGHTALGTMTALASSSSKFFQQPTNGELTTVFQRLAQDLMTTRLLDDSTN